MLDTQRNQNCGEGYKLHKEVESTEISGMKEPCYERETYNIDGLRNYVTPALEPNIPEIAAVELEKLSQSHLTPQMASQPWRLCQLSAAPVVKLCLVEAMANLPFRPP